MPTLLETVGLVDPEAQKIISKLLERFEQESLKIEGDLQEQYNIYSKYIKEKTPTFSESEKLFQNVVVPYEVRISGYDFAKYVKNAINNQIRSVTLLHVLKELLTEKSVEEVRNAHIA